MSKPLKGFITYAHKDTLAIEDFGTVIKLKPNDADGHNSRGEVYSNKGNYDGAIADFDIAIELNPNDAYAYSNRGSLYQQT